MFRLLSQKNIAKNKRSLFKAISMYRKEIIVLSDRIGKLFEQSAKSTTFGKYLKVSRGEIHESPRGIERLGYYGLSIVSKENRALKKHDFWFVEQKNKNKVWVKNRFSHLTFEIPENCLAPNIRRYAGLLNFDISDATDYTLIKPFDKLDEFLNASDIKEEERKQALKNIRNGQWEQFVKEHSSNLALFYRMDITGTGTHNLSFFSDKKMFFGGSLWNIELKDITQNKLLCLWFNSTLNLFQVLIERKETRGGWIWLDNYVLTEFAMPDLTALPKNECEKLLNIFESLGETDMPSILTQLQEKNLNRMRIDKAFLHILGMPEKETAAFLNELYNVITQEISMLREVMAEGNPHREADS